MVLYEIVYALIDSSVTENLNKIYYLRNFKDIYKDKSENILQNVAVKFTNLTQKF